MIWYVQVDNLISEYERRLFWGEGCLLIQRGYWEVLLCGDMKWIWVLVR